MYESVIYCHKHSSLVSSVFSCLSLHLISLQHFYCQSGTLPATNAGQPRTQLTLLRANPPDVSSSPFPLTSLFLPLPFYPPLPLSPPRSGCQVQLRSKKTELQASFLPERDYVTFGSLLSQFRLSSVCLSVTLVHPTQGVEPFGKISSPLCTLAIL